MCLSKNQLQGASAEAIVEAWVLSQGKNVLKPAVPDSYDLLVDSDGVFEKVQVKSTSCVSKKGAYRIQVLKGCKAKTKYTAKDFDYLAVCLSQSGNLYWIPQSEIPNGGSLNIYEGGKYEKFRVN